MKLQLTAGIKLFIVLISIPAALMLLMANSKSVSVVVHAGSGADIFARSCTRCHGTDGRAQTAKGRQTGATDFTSPKWQPNDARGIRTITNGKGKMPSFKGTLSADEIKSVWAYVRSTFK